MIGDRLRDIEKELADQRFCADWTKLLREPCGIVDIDKGQDLLLDHRAVISADRQLKQGFDPDKINRPHDDDADDGKSNDHWNDKWQSSVGTDSS